MVAPNARVVREYSQSKYNCENNYYMHSHVLVFRTERCLWPNSRHFPDTAAAEPNIIYLYSIYAVQLYLVVYELCM